MSIRKNDWTTEDLKRNNIEVRITGDEQPVVYQNDKVVKPYLIATKHKYGKNIDYYVCVVKIDGVYRMISMSNIVWVYFNDSIGDMDIDHISGDRLDNRLSNLQKITHKDNLRKRDYNNNQWTCKWDKEIAEMYTTENKEEYRQYIEDCKKKRAEVIQKREELKKEIDELTAKKMYYNNQIRLSLKAYLEIKKGVK